MGRARAAAGSILFLVVAPGVVAGLIPWLLTRWLPASPPGWVQALGWILVAAGAAILFEAFGRFVVEGIGTPAPVAPTERLVVGGLYGYVRNPMYLAVAAVILGQAAVLGRWILIAYAAAFGAAVWSFVHWYEEPALRRRFGDEYDRYCAAVPAWRPRLGDFDAPEWSPASDGAIIAPVTSVQPELWVDSPREALAFYGAAFGAEVLHLVGEGDEIVAQLAVGDAAFWVAPPSPSLKRLSPRAIDGRTSRTLLVVDDPESVVDRAVAAGATVSFPVGDEHGWLLGRIVDPFGHEWEIGRPLGAWPPDRDESG
jgi:protein-S-isoprenylcysteine O-methyltransferase Ste14/uncharacterized glyoxalase superfamily protein PhnB